MSSKEKSKPNVLLDEQQAKLIARILYVKLNPVI